MTAETRRRVKAGLPGREGLSALHENRAPVRDGGALVLGGSAAGEVDALDRVASSGQDPQSAIATCLISCAPRTRRREVACGVEVLIDRLARDLASRAFERAAGMSGAGATTGDPEMRSLRSSRPVRTARRSDLGRSLRLLRNVSGAAGRQRVRAAQAASGGVWSERLRSWRSSCGESLVMASRPSGRSGVRIAAWLSRAGRDAEPGGSEVCNQRAGEEEVLDAYAVQAESSRPKAASAGMR